MKRFTLAILVMLVMLGISMKGAASPLPTRCRVLVYVPFSFQVAERTLPSSYYQFEQVLGNSEGVEVLMIRSVDRQFYQAIATEVEKMDDTQSASRIVFHRSGGKLVLAEVCSRSKHVSLEVYDSRTHQQLIMANKENENVSLSVPSEGELLAMARPAR